MLTVGEVRARSPIVTAERIEGRINAHIEAIEQLRPSLPLIDRIAKSMIDSLTVQGTVYWLGNGGSAADSQHFAAELVGRFEYDRPGLASIALTANTSTLTAIGNDYGFDRIFARQVEALCKPKDCVMAISTSGKSPNVLQAVRSAKAIGATTIGLTGYDGGELRQLADQCLVVPVRNTAVVQELHVLVCHILCDLVEQYFFGEPTSKS